MKNMEKKFKLQLAFLFGTVLLLIVSLAWVDMISQIRVKYPIINSPILSQLFYTIIITILTIIFIYFLNPFQSDTKRTEALERARLDDNIIRSIILK